MPCCASVDRAAAGRRRLRRHRRRVGEARQLAADQPVQPARAPPRHGRRRARAAGARHQPRLVADARAPVRPLGRHWTPMRRWRAPGRRRTPPPRSGRRPAAARRAADQRPQVDLGQHALLDQPAVGLVVRLLDESGELLVQHRLQLAPGSRLEAGRSQASMTMRASTCGAQHVVGVEFVALLEHRHARAQVGELPRRAVHHRQRQARAEDLALDRVVVHQRQLRPAGATPARQIAAARRRDTSRRAARRAARRPCRAARPAPRFCSSGTASRRRCSAAVVGNRRLRAARAPCSIACDDSRQRRSSASRCRAAAPAGQGRETGGGRHGSGGARSM